MSQPETQSKKPLVQENDVGVQAMKKALKAQEAFENAMDKGEFGLKDLAIIGRFLIYLKPYWKKFALALFLGFCVSGGYVFVARIEGWIVNDLSNNQGFASFSWLIVMYGAIITVVIIAEYYSNIIFNVLGQVVVTNIRNDLFGHVESLSMAQINALPVGKYITRITNDCRGLSTFFTDVLVSMLRNLLYVVMTLAMAFFLSWKLALIFVCFLPIVFALSYFFRKKTRKHFRDQRRQRSEINGFLAENLSGIKTIKVYDREEEKSREFAGKNNALRQAYLKQIRISSFYRPAIYFLQMAAVVLVLYFAIGLIGKDQVPLTDTLFGPGEIYNFYGYTTRFFDPIQELAELLNTVQNVLTSAERVSALLSVKPSVEDGPNAKPLEHWEALSPLAGAVITANKNGMAAKDAVYDEQDLKVKGDIEFRHVWFAYAGEEWVLKDVSFHVKSRETAAFVGSTGAGKSTIIGLIVRNMIPQKGQILIDGVDVNEITIASLRTNISQMMQEVFLFSGTIGENITLFAKEPDKPRIVQSATLVGADKFITTLPGKYEAVVREAGNNFSVGQRQLLSFARAVYHKPSVMVLDEATANIDTESEETIQRSLRKMRDLGTMVIVAHRLSTIQDADCIYVIEKGRIVESGRHQRLLAQRGVYYSMFRLQDLERDLDQ